MIDGRKIKVGDYLLFYGRWNDIHDLLYMVITKDGKVPIVQQVRGFDNLVGNQYQYRFIVGGFLYKRLATKNGLVVSKKDIENYYALKELRQ